MLEFDHIPSDDEITGVDDFSVRLDHMPDRLEETHLIELGCSVSLLLNEMPDDEGCQTLLNLSHSTELENITLWLDHIPTDNELFKLKNLRLNRQTQKNLNVLIFSIPNYIDRKRLRTVNSYFTTYPYLLIEWVPSYAERKDIYLTYPALATVIALEHIPDEDELLDLSRMKPEPLLGIFLARTPDEDELERLKSVVPETILYLIETPMTDYTAFTGTRVRVEMVSTKGEMIKNLITEATR